MSEQAGEPDAGTVRPGTYARVEPADEEETAFTPPAACVAEVTENR